MLCLKSRLTGFGWRRIWRSRRVRLTSRTLLVERSTSQSRGPLLSQQLFEGHTCRLLSLFSTWTILSLGETSHAEPLHPFASSLPEFPTSFTILPPFLPRVLLFTSLCHRALSLLFRIFFRPLLILLWGGWTGTTTTSFSHESAHLLWFLDSRAGWFHHVPLGLWVCRAGSIMC